MLREGGGALRDQRAAPQCWLWLGTSESQRVLPRRRDRAGNCWGQNGEISVLTSRRTCCGSQDTKRLALAVWLRASGFTSQSLGFAVCKMGETTLPHAWWTDSVQIPALLVITLDVPLDLSELY